MSRSQDDLQSLQKEINCEVILADLADSASPSVCRFVSVPGRARAFLVCVRVPGRICVAVDGCVYGVSWVRVCCAQCARQPATVSHESCVTTLDWRWSVGWLAGCYNEILSPGISDKGPPSLNRVWRTRGGSPT